MAGKWVTSTPSFSSMISAMTLPSTLWLRVTPTMFDAVLSLSYCFWPSSSLIKSPPLLVHEFFGQLQPEVGEDALEPALGLLERLLEAHHLHLRLRPDGLEPLSRLHAVGDPVGEPLLHDLPVLLPVLLVFCQQGKHIP